MTMTRLLNHKINKQRRVRYVQGDTKNVTIDGVLIFLVIFTYFVLPKSFYTNVTSITGLTDAQLLVPWHLQRLALTLVCAGYIGICLIKERFTRSECIAIALCGICVIYNFADDVYAAAYGLISSLAGYILFKRYARGLVRFGRKMHLCLVFFTIIYICQYVVYRDDGRWVSSFTDPNISGYYLFLIYCWLRSNRYRLACVAALVAGVGSVSRNFIFCVVLFEIIVHLTRFFPLLKGAPRHVAALFTVGSLAIVLCLTWFYTSDVAQRLTGIKQNTGDYSRLVTLEDESNVTRFEANKHFIVSLLSGHMIVSGYGSGDDGSNYHVPHNAFFRSIYRYGIFYAFALWFFFFKVLNYFYLRGDIMMRAFIFALFLYYSFLGDFITGLELVLFVIFCIAIRGPLESACNE